jgi:hypothetical protein
MAPSKQFCKGIEQFLQGIKRWPPALFRSFPITLGSYVRHTALQAPHTCSAWQRWHVQLTTPEAVDRLLLTSTDYYYRTTKQLFQEIGNFRGTLR